MDDFDSYRPLLFGIAYRMLGSAMEAEDILQEAYLRYSRVSEPIKTPKAYLSKMVTNLCLDQLKSAQAQREVYVGPWLPEPLPTVEPAARLDVVDNLSMAFLVLLEKLTPPERAVFLLHEVFDYSYPEIAEIVGKDQATCRQLLHRAKQHMTAHRPRFSSTPEEQQTFMLKFMGAIGEGDVDGLVSLLAEDVTAWGDGGGKVSAARRPIIGRDAVARFMMGLRRLFTPEMTLETTVMNACPALIIRENGVVRTVMVFELDGGILRNLRSVVNPDKLRHL